MEYQDQATPQVTPKPVCAACATGYHDEVLVIPERCACPCHGTAVPEVAKSIADDCRSIADSTKSLQVPYTESVTRDFWAIADCRRGGRGMTGRYKINLNSWRTWEPEKRTARRWSLFINTCRLLANDSLNYQVTFTLDGDSPHVLITAWGTPIPRRKPNATPRHVMPQPLKAEACSVRAQEVEWFLPENQQRRNNHTTYWRRRSGRHAELNAMAEEQLRAELDYWREMELLSGQRDHFKPGLTDDTQWADDEVAA